MSFLDLIDYIRSFYYQYEIFVRIGAALAIILLAILLRRIFVNVIVRLLKKATKKTRTDFDDQLLAVIEKPARFIFLIIGIYLAMKVLPLSLKVDLFIDRVAKSFIMFSLFWAGYRASDVLASFIKHIVEKTGSKIDNMLSTFISNGLKAVVLAIGSITVLQIWVKDIAGILTGLGLGGLAFALAAKDTAANLFGSITIMIDKPFGIGDWIKTPHVEGTVEEIGFRSTRVRTFAQALVTIPNSTMSNDPITNWSRMGKRRITFRLGVTYDTTNDQMRECVRRIREMLENHPEVHPETIFVYFERFGESSLDIFLYLFTKTTVWQKYLEVQEDINLKIMDILDELGISVAFPSRSIYIENDKREEGKIQHLQ